MEQPKLKILKPIGGVHGVSAIFPKFKDLIDYEEGKIFINQGYPRFVTHPVLKILENSYKRQFKAMGAISFHSYEVAIFFVIDFFLKNQNMMFFDDGLPLKFYNFLNEKFPSLIKKSNIDEAEILFLNSKEGKFPNYRIGKKNIGLLDGNELSDIEKSKKFELLIQHDKQNDIGIVFIYDFRYLMFNALRRHCGFNVSSRKLVRNKIISPKASNKLSLRLKSRLSELEKSKTEHCFLYPTGMAAIFTSIYSLFSIKRPKFIALGSLYVDTLRILERWPENYTLSKTSFIRKDIIENLENSVDESTAGIIVEIPSNPLIELVDIEKILEIAHSKGVKVIVDNTIATPYNFNPFDYGVDIIVHSTTKFLNGKNNHIGGVIFVNSDEISDNIREFNNLTNLDMNPFDKRTLNRNLRKFEQRMKKINQNSEEVAKFLSQHKAVGNVYYPTLKDNPNYGFFEKYLSGGSGLLSFTLKESSAENASKFYDNVLNPILKGPSLGSEKTLLSPYVIMAHYNDSEEKLEQLGFDFYLMRISVGIEPVDKIIKSLENGLKHVK